MYFMYHIITLYFILNEINWLVNTKSKLNNWQEVLKINKINSEKNLNVNQYTNKDKSKTVGYVFTNVVLLFWLFIGLFSYNWVLYLIIILNNLLIVRLIDNLIKGSFNGRMILHWVNSLIGLCFGIFVIINSYHLRMDVNTWFINLLNNIF